MEDRVWKDLQDLQLNVGNIKLTTHPTCDQNRNIYVWEISYEDNFGIESFVKSVQRAREREINKTRHWERESVNYLPTSPDCHSTSWPHLCTSQSLPSCCHSNLWHINVTLSQHTVKDNRPTHKMYHKQLLWQNRTTHDTVYYTLCSRGAQHTDTTLHLTTNSKVCLGVVWEVISIVTI